MAFGPDGRLYVTTGDIHNPDLPQNRQSLNRKILRFAASGDETALAPAPGNPFSGEGGNARYVYSYGHRHPQGLAWDGAGRLYSSEHGPSGEQYDPVRYPGGSGRSSRDEVNLIEPGGNYGWPVINGTMPAPGMRTPLATSGDGPAWAPGGLALGGDGHLYMPALRGEHLRELALSEGRVVSQTEHFKGTYGRLRTATAVGGGLLVSTHTPAGQILRVPLSGLPGAGAPQPGPAGPAPVPKRPGDAGAPASARRTAHAALGRLLTRIESRLRRLGSRRVRSNGGAGARVGGLPAGSIVLRMTRRGDQRTLAVARTRVTSRSAVSVRLRLTRAGRRALAGSAVHRLALRASFAPRRGATVRRARGLRLAVSRRRAGPAS